MKTFSMLFKIHRKQQFQALKCGLQSHYFFADYNRIGNIHVVLEIAKRGKTITDEEIMKECLIIVEMKEIFPQRVNSCKIVSLSEDIRSRRVDNA